MSEFGLTISEEKSTIIEFGRCACTRAERYGWKCEIFDFLGFTHFCDKTRRGKFKLGRKTSPEEVQTEDDGYEYMAEAYPTANRVKPDKWRKVIGLKLLGHYRYYGMSGNIRSLQNFYHQVVDLPLNGSIVAARRKATSGLSFTVFSNLIHSQSRRYITHHTT